MKKTYDARMREIGGGASCGEVRLKSTEEAQDDGRGWNEDANCPTAGAQPGDAKSVWRCVAGAVAHAMRGGGEAEAVQ